MRLRPDDVALSVGVALVQLVGTAVAARHDVPVRDLDAGSTALLLAGPLALLVRRTRPLVPLLVGLLATLGYFAAGYPDGPAFVAFVVALVTVTALGRRDVGLLAAGTLAVVVVLGATLTDRVPLGPALSGVAWSVALVFGTDHVRSRRLSAAAAARARVEEERRRAGEERLQIARELHDVLAHSISLINVRAGVALHLLDDQPEQARDALVTIKQASADGLRDLRRALGVLREDPSLAPTPGIDDLDRLVEGARAAGLQVTTQVRGAPREVAAPVGLAAYRVVQEALTNVSRHAGSPRASVLLDYGVDGLEVRVDDDGPAAPDPGGGHGLSGMAERAAALGGTLAAGPRPDGGFSVHVRLPA